MSSRQQELGAFQRLLAVTPKSAQGTLASMYGDIVGDRITPLPYYIFVLLYKIHEVLQGLSSSLQTYIFIGHDSTTMKLFNLPNALGLVSSFCALTSAGITMKDFPSEVQVGEWYYVEYASDRNYEIMDFKVMQWSASEMASWPSGEMVNHFIDLYVGESSSVWKVPNMKKGVYDFFLNAIEADEQGQLNPNTTFYVRSNKFEIVGGHAPLRSKEIAGITVGAVAGLILLLVIWGVGARLWRQRRSLAVDLSEQNEGGYTDDARR